MRDYGYRTKEEVEEWKARDPIATFQTKLVDDGVATEDELEKIDREIQAEAEEAFEFAKQSPWPDPDTATAFIFSQDGVETDEPPSAADGPAAREINFMEATLEALAGEMKKNPTIFVFGEGVGERGGNFNTTVGLYDLYGTERLCDTPISERGFTGLSTGAAMAGARPVVDFMFWDFALDTLGEILNQIAKVQYMSSGRLKMPILLRGLYRRRALRRHASLGKLLPAIRSHSGTAGRDAVESLRRQRAFHHRASLSRPRYSFLSTGPYWAARATFPSNPTPYPSAKPP